MKIEMRSPSYETELPLAKTKVKFRPFLVKEEKVLLLALETGETKDIINAIYELIRTCTDNKVDPEQLSQVDVEWLFLKIRNKSMGEGLEATWDCECGKTNNILLNLENVVVQKGEEVSPTIQLTDDVWVQMKYPKISINDMLAEERGEDIVLNVISSCLDKVIDGERVYDAAEQSKEDLKEFLEHLTQVQLDKIDKFFESLPRLVYDVDASCPHCSRPTKVHLEGLQNFFV